MSLNYYVNLDSVRLHFTYFSKVVVVQFWKNFLCLALMWCMIKIAWQRNIQKPPI